MFLYEVEFYLQHQGAIGIWDTKYYKSDAKIKKLKDRFITRKNYKLFRYVTEYEKEGNC